MLLCCAASVGRGPKDQNLETDLHYICFRISIGLETKQMAIGTCLNIEGVFFRIKFSTILTLLSR